MSRADRFRADVEAIYDLDEDPVVRELLAEVCLALDDLDRLTKAAEAEPLMISGQGGKRLHPLQVEIRLRRAALAALLKTFPDVEPVV